MRFYRCLRVRWVNAQGQVQTEWALASQRGMVEKRIEEANGTLLSVRLDWQRPLTLEALIPFFLQMPLLLKSGVPLQRGLDTLAHSHTSPIFSAALYFLKHTIEKGQSLSEGMRQLKPIFPEIVPLLIEMGEKSGQLVAIFEQLHLYAHWQKTFKKNLSQHIRTPLFSLLGVLVVFGLASVFFIPAVLEFLKALGQPVSPFLVWIHEKGILSLLSVMGGFVALWMAFQWGGLPLKSLFKVPIMGTLWKNLFLLKVFSVLHLLYSSGIPLLKALEHSQTLFLKTPFFSPFGVLIRSIESGQPFSIAFKETGWSTPLIQTLLETGEYSGQLQTIFRVIQTHLKACIQEEAEKITQASGPLLTLITGGLMSGMVWSIFQPLSMAFVGMK